MDRRLKIRGVPETVLRALQKRAWRNRRSTEGKILAILTEATLNRASLVDQLSAVRVRLGANLTLDEIHKAIEEGRP